MSTAKKLLKLYANQPMKSQDPVLIKVGLKIKIIDHFIFLRGNLCTFLLKLGYCSCRV